MKTSGKRRFGGENTGASTHIWYRAVCYNETVYPAPHTYDPERFLKDGRLTNPGAGDPEERIFGSGRRYGLGTVIRDGRCLMMILDRRICPGRHFALRTLFLNIACTLAVFDISPPVDEKLEVKYFEGFVRWVVVFRVLLRNSPEMG